MNPRRPGAEPLDGQGALDVYREDFARAAARAGLERAAIGDSLAFEVASDAIRDLASTGAHFDADDVRAYSKVPLTGPTIGAAFGHAAKSGLIEEVGFAKSKTVSRHGGLIRVWRGVGSG